MSKKRINESTECNVESKISKEPLKIDERLNDESYVELDFVDRMLISSEIEFDNMSESKMQERIENYSKLGEDHFNDNDPFYSKFKDISSPKS